MNEKKQFEGKEGSYFTLAVASRSPVNLWIGRSMKRIKVKFIGFGKGKGVEHFIFEVRGGFRISLTEIEMGHVAVEEVFPGSDPVDCEMYEDVETIVSLEKKDIPTVDPVEEKEHRRTSVWRKPTIVEEIFVK